MQKVLIISYFFPPCNLTAANRIGTWEKYLPENGIYPIVITRNWTGKELTEEQRLENSGDKIRIVKQPNSEVHYLPYQSSLRDRCFIKGQNNVLYAFLSKFLTVFYLFFQNFSIKFIPYNNLYYQARKLLKEDKEIKTLIISGNPFEQFYFGYLLKKEFPHIQWIADYRDDWTTNLLTEKSKLQHVLNKYAQFFEKKWIKLADYITSVSDVYCMRLSQLHNKECNLLMNGYNSEIENVLPILKSSDFQIAYSGTIYPNQDFTLILEAISQSANKHPNLQFKLLFIGSKNHLPIHFLPKIDNLKLPNLKIELTERVDWAVNISYLRSSDVLLLSAYGNLKGIPSSKLFDYLACGQPILLAPSDNDIMEEIISETQTGYAVNDIEKLIKIIEDIIEGNVNYQPNKNKIQKFSSKKQVENLAALIKKYK